MEKMNTMKFEPMKDKSRQVKEILTQVHGALSEKGYDPVGQFVGYFMSGDPTYITSHNNARGIIARVELDEIMEELIKSYLDIK